MPEPLKASEVNSQTDPSVSKQWDDETPKSQQIEDFYKTVDGMKIGLLTTIRSGLGPVSRSMAVAKVCTSNAFVPNDVQHISNIATARRTRFPLSRQQTLQEILRSRQ